MAEIKLYLDEDISPTIAVVLRSRGYDAVSAHEIEMKGKKDEEQLDYARQEEAIANIHPAKPGRVKIAGHPGDDLAAGTLNSILKQAKLKEGKSYASFPRSDRKGK